MNVEALAEILARIPVLSETTIDDCVISPLPGLTNLNYRLQHAKGDWVLRIPKAETCQLVNREAEAHNQQLAASIGIAITPLWRDDSGLSLTPTLLGTRSLRTGDFDSEDTIALILAPIKQLHRGEFSFVGRQSVGLTLQHYYSLLDDAAKTHFSPAFDKARPSLDRIEKAESILVPSHLDPVLENMMLAQQKVWLIDWEFSAMASPYWDLAILSNAAGLEARQCRRLLEIYCTDMPLMEESTLFDYRSLLQLLSDCWMAVLAQPS